MGVTFRSDFLAAVKTSLSEWLSLSWSSSSREPKR